MKIIIIGAGFTGTQLAKRLIAEKNDVVLIDSNEETVRHASNRLDCLVVQANGNSLETLEEAGIEKADALIALTESDELNMITCSMVDTVYPDIMKIARVRNYDYYADAQKTYAAKTNHRPLYGIDYMVHPDVEAAEAIVTAVEHGAVTDVIDFENSPYELTCITIENGSRLAGVVVQNIRQMTQSHFVLAYVEQDTVATLPVGSTVLRAGDRLGIVTSPEDLPEFLELCGSKVRKLNKIILVGAGRIGSIIAERLITHKKQNFLEKFIGIKHKAAQQFVIVETDEKKAKTASEKFPDATVYNVDITEEGFLEEENLQSFDLAITATHNHDQNLITAAYLKSMGIERTVCLVANESYSVIGRQLEIDVSVPIKDTIIDTIMSHLRGKDVRSIHNVSDGDLEIAEVEITEDAAVAGKALKDVAVPGKFLILLVKASSAAEYTVPDGNTILNPHDHVVLISVQTESIRILEMFGVSA